MGPRPPLSDDARSARRAQIVRAATRLATELGWHGVTTRSLSTELGVSQPTLYREFASMVAIRDAVAVEGFVLLADRFGPTPASRDPEQALRRAAASYLDFARSHRAHYAAMFAERTGLRFATRESAPQLRDAFDALASVVPADGDRETRTELAWSTLHGIASLELQGRLRPEMREERIAAFARLFARG